MPNKPTGRDAYAVERTRVYADAYAAASYAYNQAEQYRDADPERYRAAGHEYRYAQRAFIDAFRAACVEWDANPHAAGQQPDSGAEYTICPKCHCSPCACDSW
jgi:hypothetical protein